MVPAGSKEPYERLLDDLVSSMDEIAATSAQTIRASIPSYAEAWDAIGGGVEAVVRVTLLRLIEAWRTGDQPSPEDFVWLGKIGVPPPELGVTVHDVLHAYRISGGIIIGALAEASQARAGIDPQRLLEASLSGFYYLNDLSVAISSEGLKREQERVQRRDDAERAMVAALIARPQRLDEANRLARMLGVPTLAGPWRVIVASPEESSKHPTDVLAGTVTALRRMMKAAGSPAHVLGINEGRIVALTRPVPGPESLSEIAHAVVGIGREHPGPASILDSFEEALVALEVAHLNGLPAADFSKIWLDRLLIGSLSAAELAEALLQPFGDLPEAKRRDWEHTLDTFLESDRNVAETARRLHVHPHTVRYRIEQISKRIGELSAHDQRLALQIALRARRLRRGR